jgi:hypothetical protein
LACAPTSPPPSWTAFLSHTDGRRRARSPSIPSYCRAHHISPGLYPSRSSWCHLNWTMLCWS